VGGLGKREDGGVGDVLDADEGLGDGAGGQGEGAGEDGFAKVSLGEVLGKPGAAQDGVGGAARRVASAARAPSSPRPGRRTKWPTSAAAAIPAKAAMSSAARAMARSGW